MSPTLVRWRALAAALAAVACMAASADQAERLKDRSQEARARHLFQQLRCVVCQNESIDDSDADLARDLRMIVRQQVAAGRSDDQIRTFLVDRYGEFILLRPELSVGNALLWLTPVLILMAGGALFVLRARKPIRLEAALTADEEKRVRALAGKDGPDTLRPHVGARTGPGMTET